MSRLEDMAILVEVVDRGGFSAAAARLALSKQLVSRRITDLEARLGVQLLLRTTRRIALTDLGREFVDRARRILQDADEAEQAMSSHGAAPRGTLRLSVPLSFGLSDLSPMLIGFMRLQPGVEIDLDLSDRPVDLVADGFDMAIRIGALADSTLIARKLSDLAFGICASPDYLRQRGEPETIEDLKHHSCLLFRHSKGLSWLFQLRGKLERVAVSGILRANNGEVLRDAAIAGLGLVQLPEFITGPALNDGRLVPVLAAFAPPAGAVYAVHPAHRQRSATVRALSDHLAVCFSDPASSPIYNR